MKKKIIIPIICVAVILIALLVILLIPKGNGVYSTITLDINPSIEINLDKEDKVIDVVALNDDAKELLEFETEGISLDNLLDNVAKKLWEKGYVNENRIVVLMTYTEKVDVDDFDRKIRHIFGENNIDTDIIVVDEVTEEDKKYAEEHNISPAKAAYINSIVKENSSIDKDTLLEKPIKELKDTKETGFYCDEGYTLNADFCEKEIERKDALSGNVCPSNYYEYKGKCYRDAPLEETNNYVCYGDLKLQGDKCIRTETRNAEAEYTCDKGELMRKGDVNPIGASDNDKMYCVDKSTGQAPVLRCLKSSYHMIIGGKCYNGPAPTINGGCPNGDTLVNGGCYSKDSEDQYECPNGNIYEKSKGTFVELCPDTFTYMEPKLKGYKCEEGFTLNDKKCIRTEEQPAEKERTCPSSYTLIDNAKCLNYNDTQNKQNGFYCEDDIARLEDKSCVVYDIVEAKHN